MDLTASTTYELSDEEVLALVTPVIEKAVAALPPAKDGVDGAPGKDGLNGVDGAPGKDGVDGLPGKDGAPGKDGDQGPAGPPGSGATYGVALDSFAGATDDDKLTAALTFAAKQSQIPAILFPTRTVKLTKAQTPFSGMKLVGPNPGGSMNLELASGSYVNHKVDLTGLVGALFTNKGTLYDVFVKGLAFQGNRTQQFWDSSVATLYASSFDNLTFYGMGSVFGSAKSKSLLTQVNFTGIWTVNGYRNMQFNDGGSDCTFWESGYCNMQADAGMGDTDFPFWANGLGKTQIGNLYLTAPNGKGLRVTPNSEGPTNFSGGLRLEGYHSDKPATVLLQVDGGPVNFSQAWFAYGKTVTATGATFSQCAYSADTRALFPA